MAAEIRIGTSGWHYQHWRGPFYAERCPANKMLDFYVQHFDTVEINNSFYKLPSAETFQFWRAATPRNFNFAVKASRFITHNKKLKDPENALDRFLPPAEELREKLGPILFQLPPKWRINVERLDEFLSMLPKGRRRRYAFEFREPSWLDEKVYRVLRRHNAAFCIYELAGFRTPLNVTADWTYVRLHGPGSKYQGSYSTEQLEEWAKHIAAWRSKMQAIYVYFDNDDSGYAAHNALELRRLVAARIRESDKAAA
ncbi:MAG TPA: DUF72 domain-containing protein [Terriglobales bacterium]|nr:DUF72 domain-containing protein [Terriglobales bacterium]